MFLFLFYYGCVHNVQKIITEMFIFDNKGVYKVRVFLFLNHNFDYIAIKIKIIQVQTRLLKKPMYLYSYLLIAGLTL